MRQKLYVDTGQVQGTHVASLQKPTLPTLSNWQSAVLAYMSVKCGIMFTSIEQTESWLRTNRQNPQHLSVSAICGLLFIEPPKRVRIFSPHPLPTAASFNRSRATRFNPAQASRPAIRLDR